MSIVSGGKFVSPLHRVISPERTVSEGESASPPDRTSVVFFYYPKYEAKVPDGGAVLRTSKDDSTTLPLVNEVEREFVDECGAAATERFRRKNAMYSLFQDQANAAGEEYRGGKSVEGGKEAQSQEGEGGAAKQSEMCFGDFLSQKWAQVARTT